MQIPICILNVFNENQKEYSEATNGYTIYIVEDEAFSDKSTADKYAKLCKINNEMSGGTGAIQRKTITIDKISDKKIETDLLRIETHRKKTQVADAKNKADEASKKVAKK